MLLALALPAGLAAKQPSGSPPASPITEVFRGRTMTLQRNLAQPFDSMPGRLFSYKPTPAQLSIGYVAQHLASDNYFVCNLFGDMKAPVAAEDTSTTDAVKDTWAQGKTAGEAQRVVRVLREGCGAARPREAGRPGHHDVPRAVADGGQIANYMRLDNLVPPTALLRPAAPHQ